MKASNKLQRYEKVAEKKISTSVDALCKGLPEEISFYMKYCRSLQFEETPNYRYGNVLTINYKPNNNFSVLRSLFKSMLTKKGYRYDYIYDWTKVNHKLKEFLQNEQNENKPPSPIATPLENQFFLQDYENTS